MLARTQRRYRVPQTRVVPAAQPVDMAAPYGGLNTRDEIARLAPTDATRMVNWFPGVGNVRVRDGSTTHQSSVGSGNVDTVVEFRSGAVLKLLAASNGNVYDATSTPSSLASGFSLNRWQTAMLDGVQGWVNGTDAPQKYDGTTWSAMTLTGPTAANVIGIMAHRSRTYFFEDGSASFWYSAVNAMGGTVTEFKLGRVGIAGNIICMGSINVEGGSDVWGGGGVGNDLAVFVMSSGVAVVYDGDDPGSNWSLVGVYPVGAPIDVRSIARHGSDLYLLTTAGLISVPRLISAGRLDARGMVSDRIRPTLVAAVDAYRANTGWQVLADATRSMVIVNVPISATEFQQYVMNIETGAWGGPWKGMNARAWGIYNDRLYFGDTAAKVIRYTGTSDNGTAIVGDVQTAFQAVPGSGQCTALRGVFKGSGTVTIGLGAQYDYQTTDVSLTTRAIGPTQSDWDSVGVDWEDWEDLWGTPPSITFRQWFSAAGVGASLGARLQTSTTEALSWESTRYLIKQGMGIV